MMLSSCHIPVIKNIGVWSITVTKVTNARTHQFTFLFIKSVRMKSFPGIFPHFSCIIKSTTLAVTTANAGRAVRLLSSLLMVLEEFVHGHVNRTWAVEMDRVLRRQMKMKPFCFHIIPSSFAAEITYIPLYVWLDLGPKGFWIKYVCPMVLNKDVFAIQSLSITIQAPPFHLCLRGSVRKG